MVKFNFKSTPKISDSFKKEEKGKKESQPDEEKTITAEDFADLSFDTIDSIENERDEKSESESETKSELETPPRRLEPGESVDEQDVQPRAYTEEYEEVQSSPKLKWILIIGLAVIILGVGIYFSFNFLKSFFKSAPVATTPRVEKPVTEEQQQVESTINQKLLTTYQKNVAFNSSIRNSIQTIFSKKPASAEYSMIVITSSEIHLTALGNSRDQIAQFHLDLKKTFPQSGFELIAAQRKIQNGKEMFYADFAADIKKAGSSGNNLKISSTEEPQNFRNEFRSLTQKHSLGLQYFNEGHKTNKKAFKEITYYATLSGKRTNILKFLSSLVNSFPMIQINKFSLYPYNLNTISDGNLLSSLNLTYYKQN